MADPNAVPVNVAIHGFTWGAVGTWALFFSVTGAMAAVLRAVGLSKIVELIVNRGKDLRIEQREDEMTAERRIEALEIRATKAEWRLNHVLTACTGLISALEQASPGNPALEAARDQLRMAAMAETVDPFAEMLVRLGGVHRGPDGKVEL